MGRIKIPTPRIAETLPSVLGDSIAQEVPMRVGNLTDQRSVYVDGNKGLVYVHPNGSNPQGVYQAKNGIPSVELRYGAEVMVKRTATNERVVTRLNTEVIEQYLGTEAVNPPSPTDISDFYYCTLQPTSPPSMYVYITEIGYVYNGVDGWRKGSLSADFSASPAQAGGGTIEVPTTPNSARWVMVQFDPSDASISYKQGSVVDARVPYESIHENTSYIPATDSGCKRIGSFQLVTGITGITRTHIKNTPPFIGSSAGSFANLTDTTITGGAAGDIYYNNGSAIINLGKGSDGQVLTLASGVPSWATPSGGGGSGLTYLYRGSGSESWSSLVSGTTSGDFEFTTVYNLTGFGVSTSVITIPAVAGYYMVGLNLTLWNDDDAPGTAYTGYIRIKIEGANTHDINLPVINENTSDFVGFTLPFLFAASDTFELSYSLQARGATMPDGSIDLDMYLLNIIET